jgi:hypothetical protein
LKPCSHGGAEHLNHFRSVVADDVKADEAVGGGVDNELHQDRRVAA